jgi:hypothetical protein
MLHGICSNFRIQVQEVKAFPKAYSDDPCTQNKCEDVVELCIPM